MRDEQFDHRKSSNIRIEGVEDDAFDREVMKDARRRERAQTTLAATRSAKTGVSGIGNTIKAAFTEPVVVVALVVLAFVIVFMRAYMVPSGSMRPTLVEGDRLLSIARYFPNGSTYSRGDVVCFTAPDGTVYVKRVIGIGGDHIQISGEKVYVNGEECEWQGTGGVMTSMDVRLGPDEYWVMGDNRANSQDSRFIGAIPASSMISKVYCIYYPFDRATIL